MELISPKSFFLVIPTRERKEHLLNLLQDLNAFEKYISNCVIVDQSEHFLADGFDYSDFNFRITILKGDKSKGVNHSRNIALTQYNDEDWFFFLDDDLRVEQEDLEKIPGILNEGKYDVLIPGNNKIFTQNIKAVYNTQLETLCKPQSYDETTNRIMISSGLSIVNKSFFFKAGGCFDEKFTFWGDDWDFGIRLYKAGATIKYFPHLNFTHLEAPRGGQRDFKKDIPIEKDKLFLEYYFLSKHFSKKVLKERVLIDILYAIRNFNLNKIPFCLKYYRKLSRKTAKTFK